MSHAQAYKEVSRTIEEAKQKKGSVGVGQGMPGDQGSLHVGQMDRAKQKSTLCY